MEETVKEFYHSITCQEKLFTSHISWSVCFNKGSRLYLTDPTKSVGSCGMTAKWDLRSWSPIVEMSRSSITIFPSVGSTKRNKALMKVVFPLPVRPTIPILCLPSIVQVIPWRTSGAFGRYLTCLMSFGVSNHRYQFLNRNWICFRSLPSNWIFPLYHQQASWC